MYILFAFLLGSFLSVMISVNGSLVSAFDSYNGTMLIHWFGLITTGILLAASRQRIHFDRKAPKWIYFAGVVGILTTLFQSSSFGRISMLNISALGLLGQTVASLFIDSFGLFGMKKHSFRRNTLIGFLFALAGIFLMLDSSAGSSLPAVLMSLAAGVSIVTARSMNSRLADSIGNLQGTMINFVAAFPITLLLALTFGAHPGQLPVLSDAPWWMYLGGICGVFGVFMNNYLVPHMSAFQMTLMTFLGMLFGSTLIDLITGAAYSLQSLAGGLLIAAGMILNMFLKHQEEKKAADR